jgi:uncharacterized protein Yka (UPF0111/DUF47 family)
MWTIVGILIALIPAFTIGILIWVFRSIKVDWKKEREEKEAKTEEVKADRVEKPFEEERLRKFYSPKHVLRTEIKILNHQMDKALDGGELRRKISAWWNGEEY